MQKDDLKHLAKVIKDTEERIAELERDKLKEAQAWRLKIINENLDVNKNLLAQCKQWFWNDKNANKENSNIPSN